MMRIGISADHGGFSLKGELAESLRRAGPDVADFGADRLDPADDYPDFVVTLAPGRRCGRSRARRGTYAAAALEPPSLRTRFPGWVPDLSMMSFLTAHFSDALRDRCRLAKVRALELAKIVP